jgi:hypothetical protein
MIIPKNTEGTMDSETFLKGAALFGVARRKAKMLGSAPGGLKLAELIHLIQLREGHTPCFRTRKSCREMTCCWQLSCGAAMSPDA